jgi:hypothetical protein
MRTDFQRNYDDHCMVHHCHKMVGREEEVHHHMVLHLVAIAIRQVERPRV